MKAFSYLLYIGLSIALLFAVGCATGESTISPAFHDVQPEEVALVEVSGDIKGDAPKNQVEDFFAMEMLEKGYQVIERSRVDSVLEEQDFQRSDRTTDQEMAQIGEIMNVPAVATLDAHVAGEKVSVTGRMIDAETAEVLWVGTSRGGSGSTLATVGGAIGGAVAGSEVADSAGAVAGGVLGGAAGDALSPQAARVVQNAIKEMVDELPARH